MLKIPLFDNEKQQTLKNKSILKYLEKLKDDKL